jgi:hypothetical protein
MTDIKYLIDVFIKTWPLMVAIIVFGAILWRNQWLFKQQLATIAKNTKEHLERHDELFKGIFRHKEDCLKHRTECEQNFVSKTDLTQLLYHGNHN